MRGRFIVEADSALGIGGVNRRWQRLGNAFETLQWNARLAGLPGLHRKCALPEDIDGAADRAVRVFQHRDIDQGGDPDAVGAFDLNELIARVLSRGQGRGHRALGMRNVRAVQAVEAV